MKREHEFFRTLTEGLRTNSITTIDDVVNIYKGIADLGSEDLDYQYGLSQRLRKFLAELISKRIDNSLGDEIAREWREKISESIMKNEEISPFADLSSAERNILSGISTFLEMNDTESVKRKTLEHAGMIQAGHDDLSKVRYINKWTLPWSIISTILSILFGILALIR